MFNWILSLFSKNKEEISLPYSKDELNYLLSLEYSNQDIKDAFQELFIVKIPQGEKYILSSRLFVIYSSKNQLSIYFNNKTTPLPLKKLTYNINIMEILLSQDIPDEISNYLKKLHSIREDLYHYRSKVTLRKYRQRYFK